MRYISQKQLEDKLKPLDIKALIAKETNGRMRIRLLALLHIKEGANRAKTAIYLKSSRKAVNDWAKNFYENGLDGLKEKPRTGRPCHLTPEQLITFKEYVIANSIKPSGGRLTGQYLVRYIKKELGVTYCLDNIYRRLNLLRFSWITSRSKHPKQSQEIQESFKKIQN
jgi:transposase